ncbi:nucleotidyltransferase family protein [Rhizobium sp. 25PS6]|uniref:nucleotidyltransferase family protein n=1 Tax=Rhizobium sp. 25PS6 TaxID=3075622 RepID=UPI0028FDAE64|nr:nucleotidyltransferase family protein [Rhizobium sp. 25PS6]MDU0359802.1 nucleotidyltransferase family protein [Rhizobium sp. 25PS6]
MEDEQFRQLQGIVLKSQMLSALLHNWEKVALPDSWLVAGAIAQTVWNHRFGFPPAHGINDIDIVYFDASDRSEETEAEHAARVRRAFSDLSIWIDVKNEARVHLWYETKFGYPIKPYLSTADAIDTFPTTATAVGLCPRNGSLDLCAPFGLSDLLEGVVRPNKKQISREIYEQKVSRWVRVWPNLNVMGWLEDG